MDIRFGPYVASRKDISSLTQALRENIGSVDSLEGRDQPKREGYFSSQSYLFQGDSVNVSVWEHAIDHPSARTQDTKSFRLEISISSDVRSIAQQTFTKAYELANNILETSAYEATEDL